MTATSRPRSASSTRTSRTDRGRLPGEIKSTLYPLDFIVDSLADYPTAVCAVRRSRSTAACEDAGFRIRSPGRLGNLPASAHLKLSGGAACRWFLSRTTLGTADQPREIRTKPLGLTIANSAGSCSRNQTPRSRIFSASGRFRRFAFRSRSGLTPHARPVLPPLRVTRRKRVHARHIGYCQQTPSNSGRARKPTLVYVASWIKPPASMCSSLAGGIGFFAHSLQESLVSGDPRNPSRNGQSSNEAMAQAVRW